MLTTTKHICAMLTFACVQDTCPDPPIHTLAPCSLVWASMHTHLPKSLIPHLCAPEPCSHPFTHTCTMLTPIHPHLHHARRVDFLRPPTAGHILGIDGDSARSVQDHQHAVGKAALVHQHLRPHVKQPGVKHTHQPSVVLGKCMRCVCLKRHATCMMAGRPVMYIT